MFWKDSFSCNRKSLFAAHYYTLQTFFYLGYKIRHKINVLILQIHKK